MDAQAHGNRRPATGERHPADGGSPGYHARTGRLAELQLQEYSIPGHQSETGQAGTEFQADMKLLGATLIKLPARPRTLDKVHTTLWNSLPKRCYLSGIHIQKGSHGTPHPRDTCDRLRPG